jgi:hypothetical protein
LTLDVQAVFEQTYDSGPYPDRIDHNAAPSPPLPPALNEWADQLLRDAKLRTAN